MKQKLKIVVLALLGWLVIVGCSTTRVYNPGTQQIRTQSSAEVVYRSIRDVGDERGWYIRKIKPGVAQGKIALRSHVAVIRITYSRSAYRIQYVQSRNLKYNTRKGTIHQKYNGWIRNLENAINARL